MNTGNKIMSGLLASGGGVAAAFIGHAAHWAYWPVPLAVAAGVDLMVIAARSSPAPGRAFAESADEGYVPHTGPHREDAVRNVRLQSLTPDYDFLFSATVRWRPLDDARLRQNSVNANPGALAATAIIERARAVALNEYPEFHPEARNHLATALGHTEPDPTGLVEACAINVSLIVPPEDLDRVTQQTRLRKEAELWARRREFERERRSYFAEDVFKSTGSAVVWMLAQEGHSTQDIHRTVGMIGPLARLSAAANETEVSELYHDLAFPPSPAEEEPEESIGPFDPVFGNPAAGCGPAAEPSAAQPPLEPDEENAADRLADRVAEAIRDFAATAGSEQSTLFGRQMARVFDGIEHPDTAALIRDAFGISVRATAAATATGTTTRPGAAKEDPGSQNGFAWAVNQRTAPEPATSAEPENKAEANAIDGYDPWGEHANDVY